MHRQILKFMAKKSYTKDTSIVQLYERELPSGAIRFYLHYTHNGQRVREPLKAIPIVEKSDRLNYKEAKAKAQAIAFERIAEIRSGQLGLANRHSNVLLSEWLGMCVERARNREREGMNRHTWARTIEYTGELLERYRSGATLADVDKDYVLGFVDYLKHGYVIGRNLQSAGKHLKPSSADKKLSAFSFVLKEAVKDGIIERNPFDLIEPSDRIKVPESTREYLTEEELKRLEATPITNETTRNVYLFMCCCGLRISDVKRLRWEDIERDGDRWRIRIRQQKTQQPVYLPLSKAARAFMPEQDDLPADSRIFADMPSEQTMNRVLKIWAESAGITKNVTLHTARHTYCTMLLTKGTDLYTVSKMAGHSDIKTTQIYAKIIDKRKEEAADVFDEIF